MKNGSPAWQRKLGACLIIASLCASVLLLVYQIRFIPLFFESLRLRTSHVFLRNPINDYPVFLHGRLKTGGFWNYCWVAFAVKTSVPFLALCALSLVFGGDFHHINSAHPNRELLIVSATYLQGYGLSDPWVFEWLKHKKPIAQLAYQIFVCDITRDPISQLRVGRIYLRNKQYDFARRQLERARDLLPDSPLKNEVVSHLSELPH